MARGRQPDELTADELRIATAMREMRRGAAMARLRDRIHGDAGLDLGQQDTLEVVVARGEARMSDVAAALRVDPSTATRAVARLEAAGLVERRRASADARSVVVAPTPAGLALRDRQVRIARGAMRALFNRFSPAEQAMLADLLDRLVAGLDELVADDAGLPRAASSD